MLLFVFLLDGNFHSRLSEAHEHADLAYDGWHPSLNGFSSNIFIMLVFSIFLTVSKISMFDFVNVTGMF